MAVSRAEMIALFPTGGAIPEELQIGRSKAIADITAAALGGRTLIFAENRRLGKSSMLLAMTDRILRCGDDRSALSVDLRDGVGDSTSLASMLLKQAGKQGAASKIEGMLAKGKLAKLTPSASRGLRAAAGILGVQDELAAAVAIEGMLTSGDIHLRDALLALDAHGRAADERTVVVLDEAQELVRWSDAADVQNEIASTIKRPGSTVNFVFSGSEKSMLLGLYEDPNGPLQGLGQRFHLPDISRDDWCSGLRERFHRCGVAAAPEHLHEIVYRSEGHPLRTMLICAHVLDWLVEGLGINAASVTRAVDDAERHPSWSLV
jgi:hypothetical protein